MKHFIDELHISISSGDGGSGCVSFHREKFVAKGGPDGGNGGRGGNVLVRIKNNVKTLTHIPNNSHISAQNGRAGGSRNKSGKNGEDIIIDLPAGSVIRDTTTNEIILELIDLPQLHDHDHDECILILQGGIGGKGNAQFKSSRNQTPRYSQPGMPGESRDITIELSIIADIGLVGFPNAGKSSLINVLTHARSPVAPYPFTTKKPHLGALKIHHDELIIADIPGLIAGASSGIGLGHQFLKHISRTALLAFLIDLSDDETTYTTAFATLCNELCEYDATLLNRSRIIVGTKLDIAPHNALEKLIEQLPSEEVIGISSVARINTDILQNRLYHIWSAQKNSQEP